VLQFTPPIESKKGKIDDQLKKISAALLARNAEKIERGEPSKVLPQLVEGGTAGGAYPKTLILSYADGTLRVGPPDGEGVPSILKFDFSKKGEHAACEHAYAMMAQAAGINVVATSLINEEGIQQRRHLLIKRFDIPNQKNFQQRLHFHSLSGLLHKSPTDLDYQDFFRAALRLKLPQLEIEEIARRLIFNLLASNHDDHGKNHAFLYHEKNRTWHLTPAYDLNYTPGLLERGMSICGEVWPAMKTVEALCVDAGVTQRVFRSLLQKVERSIARWPYFAKKTDVSKSMIEEIRKRHEFIRAHVMQK